MEINNILYIPKSLNELIFGSDNNYSKYFIFIFIAIAVVALSVNIIKKIVFSSWFVVLVVVQALIIYSYYKIQEKYNKNRDQFKEVSERCKKKKLSKRQIELCGVLEKTTKDYNKIGNIIKKEFYN